VGILSCKKLLESAILLGCCVDESAMGMWAEIRLVSGFKPPGMPEIPPPGCLA